MLLLRFHKRWAVDKLNPAPAPTEAPGILQSEYNSLRILAWVTFLAVFLFAAAFVYCLIRFRKLIAIVYRAVTNRNTLVEHASEDDIEGPTGHEFSASRGAQPLVSEGVDTQAVQVGVGDVVELFIPPMFELLRTRS